MTKRKVFEELKLALEGALAHEQGEKIDLQTANMPQEKPITTINTETTDQQLKERRKKLGGTKGTK